jgi:hypothetical protein
VSAEANTSAKLPRSITGADCATKLENKINKAQKSFKILQFFNTLTVSEPKVKTPMFDHLFDLLTFQTLLRSQ